MSRFSMTQAACAVALASLALACGASAQRAQPSAPEASTTSAPSAEAPARLAPEPQAPDLGSPDSILDGQQPYLVVYRFTPRWTGDDPVQKNTLRAHAQYLLSLYRAGALKLAGGFGDGSGGAMFFTAADDDAAQAIVQADPAVLEGIFEPSLRPWRPANWRERDQTWPR